jgi:[pyruvate, water dikinase]-phosphate phosphotransferase / [pyruvate, water dikinase] kinase
MNKRTAFFVSDRTGLTAETLGRSLLSQFDGIEFQRVTLPYLDTADKAHAAVAHINAAVQADGQRPLLFSTLLLPEVRDIIAQSDALVLDLFEMFIAPLEAELGIASSHAIGRSHGVGTSYTARMDAVNYALSHDDGGITRELPRADIVLVGVSRCGKTPTSLYLALQFGIYAANYPLVPEDFATGKLPAALMPLRNKLFGLTIAPARLHQIRAERTPDSRYASLENCRNEVRQAENLMVRFAIPFLDVTSMSVEEIATTLLHRVGLKR